MPNNPVSLLVMIVLAAFVIDRIVAGLLFLLSFSSSWNERFPDPTSIVNSETRRQIEKKQKLAYFLLASLFALVFLLSFKQVGVLKALGFHSVETTPTSVATSTAATTPGVTTPPSDPNRRTSGDFLVTWLILVGGAENIARLLKSQGDFGQPQKESQPIEITGKLTLEDRSKQA